MTLEQKREIIIKNKDPAIAALESVTDRIHYITDPLLDENGEIIKTGLEDKVYNFSKDLRKDADKYEKVRGKLLAGDFNLSLTEINYIAIAFRYSVIDMDKKIKLMEKAIVEISSIVNDLLSADLNS